MIIDLDDVWEDHDRLDLLRKLKDANPKFCCTLFAVPGRGSPSYWEQMPEWCELAVHGWLHHDSYECASWTRERMERLLDEPLVAEFFVTGFKAPGWQISDACYQVLLERGWWVADQHLEDARRPEGLRTYFYEDGEDRWHGHIDWNGSGNDLAENFDTVLGRVKDASEFRFASSATR